MYYFSFNPPEVTVKVPDDFSGRIIAFGYTKLEDEQVTPPYERPDSIYNLTQSVFQEVYPDKKIEVLIGSNLQNISDNLDTIDFNSSDLIYNAVFLTLM